MNLLKVKLPQLNARLQPYQVGIATGALVAFFAGLAIVGGGWAVVIAVVCIVIGAAFGIVVGEVLAKRDSADRIAILEEHYDDAAKLVYQLNAQNMALEARAQAAERDLLDAAAEKTALRAELEQLRTARTR